MAFHETRFPDDISRGSGGGPERRVDIVTLRSGFEERNAIWADSRRSYDASLGIRDIDDLYEVIHFFEGRRGKLHGFRWKDWSDWKSCPPGDPVSAVDQVIGTGDGVNKIFQAKKIYSAGANEWTRDIKKLVTGSVRVSVNNVEKTITTDFTVDYNTGVITFVTAPPNTHTVKAGFEFDVPVRFNIDKLDISLEGFEAGSLPQIDIMEIRV